MNGLPKSSSPVMYNPASIFNFKSSNHSQTFISETQTNSPFPPLTPINKEYDDIDNWKTMLDEIYTNSFHLREKNTKLRNPTPHLKLIESSLKNHLLHQHQQQWQPKKQRPVVEFRKTVKTKCPGQNDINTSITQTNNYNNNNNRSDSNTPSSLNDVTMKKKSKYTPTKYESKKKNKTVRRITHNENRFFNERPTNSYYDNDKKITDIALATDNVDLLNSLKETNRVISLLRSPKDPNIEKVQQLNKNLLDVTENLVQIIKKINEHDNSIKTDNPFEVGLLGSIAKTKQMIRKINDLSSKNDYSYYVDSDSGDDNVIVGNDNNNQYYIETISKKNNNLIKGKNIEAIYRNNNINTNTATTTSSNSSRRVSINNNYVIHDYHKSDEEADDEGEYGESISSKNSKGKTNHGSKTDDDDENISFHTADSDNDNYNTEDQYTEVTQQQDSQTGSPFSLSKIFNRFISRSSSSSTDDSQSINNDNSKDNKSVNQHEQLSDYESYINKYMNGPNKRVRNIPNKAITSSASSSSIRSIKDSNKKDNNDKSNRTKDSNDNDKGTKSLKKQNKKKTSSSKKTSNSNANTNHPNSNNGNSSNNGEAPSVKLKLTLNLNKQHSPTSSSNKNDNQIPKKRDNHGNINNQGPTSTKTTAITNTDNTTTTTDAPPTDKKKTPLRKKE
ncbi:unnamed protein product [Cunninghamella blakesleeana]